MPRPRLPREVHEIQGTWVRAAGNSPSAALATAAGVPTMPNDLPAEAVELWRLVAETRRQWLAPSDGPALRLLCETWALLRRTSAKLTDDPADKLNRCAHTNYAAQFLQLATRFGLTPSDRAKLGEVYYGADDPAAEFVA